MSEVIPNSELAAVTETAVIDENGIGLLLSLGEYSLARIRVSPDAYAINDPDWQHPAFYDTLHDGITGLLIRAAKASPETVSALWSVITTIKEQGEILQNAVLDVRH